MNHQWIAASVVLLASAGACADEAPPAKGGQAPEQVQVAPANGTAGLEVVDIGRPDKPGKGATPRAAEAKLDRAQLRRELRELRAERHERFEARRDRRAEPREPRERRTAREEQRDERRERQRSR